MGGWFIYVRDWVGGGEYCFFSIFCSAFVVFLITLS